MIAAPDVCRRPLVLLLVAAAAAALLAAPRSATTRERVALRDLVAKADPLAAHDLTFDATFAAEAVAGLRSREPGLPDRLAELPAITHILAHARNFDYDVPKDSRSALVRNLLGPPQADTSRIATCVQATDFFLGPMLADPRWLADTLRYLPADFRYRGTLFLTFGYDIGVAFAPNASLNCTHRRFDHPREVLYFAIHELHHVGFMTIHPPPRFSDIKTCADLLALVEYSTQLEGMAVLAAYDRRRQDGALGDDGDYVALGDDARMRAEVGSYMAEYDALRRRGTQSADAAAWAVIERMSSGERLWYRVGAEMARRIEASGGRAALVELVKQGPARFQAAGRAALQAGTVLAQARMAATRASDGPLLVR